MINRVTHFYTSNIKLIKYNFVALIWFLLLYKMLTALVVYPLILLGLNFSIDRAGLGYLTFDNLNRFVTNPISILVTIILLLIIVFFAIYELVVLILCYELSRNEQKINTLDLALAGLLRMKKIIHPSSIVFFCVMLVVVSLLDLPFASSLISSSGLPNFVFDQALSSPLFIVAAIIVALFFLWWFGLYLMSIHHILLSGCSARHAMRITRQSIRGKRIKITLRLLFWYLSIVIVMMLLYLSTLFLFGGIVRLFLSSKDQLAVFLTGARFIGRAVALALYTFFTPLFLAFITNYFHQIKGPDAKKYEKEGCPFIKKQFQRHNLIFFLILLALTASNIGVIYQSFSEGIMRQVVFARVPEITAHRGSSFRAPENTISAVELAIEEFADYSEIDVRLTADDVIVLMHDDNLKRTTGQDALIWDVSYEEIMQLEAGAFFSEEFRGEPIPTLEEVILRAGNDIKLNIELKTSIQSPNLARKVAELVVELDFVDRCVITSFDQNALIEVKEVNPDIQTGLIMVMPMGQYTRLEGVDFYSLNAVFVSNRQVDMLHRRGHSIHVWGARDPLVVARMAEYGADNIIAPDPLLTREVLYTQYADPLVIFVARTMFEDVNIISRPSTLFPIRF